MSDLTDYNIPAVQKKVESELEPLIKAGSATKDEIKQFMDSFTADGYKQVQFMCFGDAIEDLRSLYHGCIVLIISPRLMDNKNNGRGPCFSISSKTQAHVIGYAEDYYVCQGVSLVANEPVKCRNFLNKSSLKVCARH